jgi:hypothetical protein
MLSGPVLTGAKTVAAQCEAAATAVGVMGLKGGLSLEAAGNLVNALTIVSVLAAAAFGLMGFFTSNKDTKGRLTWAGRIAVCGVLLTALLSIASRTVEGKIAAATSAQAHQVEVCRQTAAAAQFQEQIGRLETLNSGLVEVSGKSAKIRERLEGSIETQQRQLASAKQISNDLAATGRASQANADALLRSVWESREQVSARDLRVRIDLECRYYDYDMNHRARLDPSVDPKALDALTPASAFDTASALSLAVFAANGTSATAPITLQSSVDFERAEPAPVLIATSHEHSALTRPSKASAPGRAYGYHAVQQAVEFLNFDGDRIGLSKRPDWNGVMIQIAMQTIQSPFMGQLRAANPGGMFPDSDPSRKGWVFGQRAFPLWEGTYRPRDASEATAMLTSDEWLTPCLAEVTVWLGDQSLGRAFGRLHTGRAFVNRSYSDSVGLLAPPLRVASDRFPDFNPEKTAPR